MATKKKKAKAKAKKFTRATLMRAMQQLGENPQELFSIVREISPQAAIEMDRIQQEQQAALLPPQATEPEWDQGVLQGGIFTGQEMARIRDRTDLPLYDSILYPDTTYEGKPWLVGFFEDNALAEFRCFTSANNIGWPNRCNMQIQGCLAADRTYVIRGLQVKIWSDRQDKWSNILAMADALARYDLVVGERPFGTFHPPYNPIHAEQLRVLNMDYNLEQVIHIPARQNFGVKVTVPLHVKSEFEDQIKDGAKFLWRVSLIGTLTRDVA